MLLRSVIGRHHQNGRRQTRMRVVSALAICVSLTACGGYTGTKSGRTNLGPGDLVEIVEQEQGAPPNSHPVTLEAAEISRALASIRFGGERAGPNEPGGRQLFTDSDLRLASVALQDAFSRAGPRQDIALRLAQLRSSDLISIVRASHITAARLFYVDDRLHVILARVDEKPGHTFATAGTPTPKINYSVTDSARFFADEIGSRTRITAIDWSPYLPHGIQFHSHERHDWLEIDMNAFHAAINLPSASPARSEPVQPSRTLQDKSYTLEDRLKKLRDLHQQGLISDELYDQKMRELVDSHLR